MLIAHASGGMQQPLFPAIPSFFICALQKAVFFLRTICGGRGGVCGRRRANLVAHSHSSRCRCAASGMSIVASAFCTLPFAVACSSGWGARTGGWAGRARPGVEALEGRGCQWVGVQWSGDSGACWLAGRWLVLFGGLLRVPSPVSLTPGWINGLPTTKSSVWPTTAFLTVVQRLTSNEP